MSEEPNIKNLRALARRLRKALSASSECAKELHGFINAHQNSSNPVVQWARSLWQSRSRGLGEAFSGTIAVLETIEQTALGTSARDFKQRRIHTRSARDLILDSLMEIGTMAYTQQLKAYAISRFGKDIPSTRFGSVSRDEERACRSGTGPAREVWLCHGLTHNSGRPVRRLWARSDWDLSERIVAPSTGRVIFMKLTVRLIELAEQYKDIAASGMQLRRLALDHARDMGLDTFLERQSTSELREAALNLLKPLEEEDLRQRRQAAGRMARELAGPDLLFGRRDRAHSKRRGQKAASK